METSGRGIRKRPPRQIGALDSCVVKLGAEVKCRQPGCETQSLGMFDYNHADQDDLHII